MNIKDFAEIVLNKKDYHYRQQAIAKLKHGIKHEEKWNDQHRKEVQQLINFLENGSSNIDELKNYL